MWLADQLVYQAVIISVGWESNVPRSLILLLDFHTFICASQENLVLKEGNKQRKQRLFRTWSWFLQLYWPIAWDFSTFSATRTEMKAWQEVVKICLLFSISGFLYNLIPWFCIFLGVEEWSVNWIGSGTLMPYPEWYLGWPVLVALNGGLHSKMCYWDQMCT